MSLPTREWPWALFSLCLWTLILIGIYARCSYAQPAMIQPGPEYQGTVRVRGGEIDPGKSIGVYTLGVVKMGCKSTPGPDLLAIVNVDWPADAKHVWSVAWSEEGCVGYGIQSPNSFHRLDTSKWDWVEAVPEPELADMLAAGIVFLLVTRSLKLWRWR